MTTLKVLRDTDTAEPTRIKYDSDLVYAGFAIAHDDRGVVAELDCLGTYEIHDGDATAFVELQELHRALRLVDAVGWVDRVYALGQEVGA